MKKSYNLRAWSERSDSFMVCTHIICLLFSFQASNRRRLQDNADVCRILCHIAGICKLQIIQLYQSTLPSKGMILILITFRSKSFVFILMNNEEIDQLQLWGPTRGSGILGRRVIYFQGSWEQRTTSGGFRAGNRDLRKN